MKPILSPFQGLALCHEFTLPQCYISTCTPCPHSPLGMPSGGTGTCHSLKWKGHKEMPDQMKNRQDRPMNRAAVYLPPPSPSTVTPSNTFTAFRHSLPLAP
ncbi:hypothetical protein AAFF_G00284630 [Aldrovandia affinis]|uniref:Uncharacterized protein n=1 Tax=Aldrovandia affinis TaxID=143900 RepID=A0AAD7X142_9TELE|nr:hypothetical protein AAFF_G00284630 [Aldrovandia affinis]